MQSIKTLITKIKFLSQRDKNESKTHTVGLKAGWSVIMEMTQDVELHGGPPRLKWGSRGNPRKQP